MRNVIASLGLLVLVGLNQTSLAAGKDSSANKNKSAAPAGNTKDESAAAKKLLAAMATFEDKARGVTVSYPKNWKVEQPQNTAHIARFKPADIAGMSISLSTQDAFKNETLAEFVAETNERAVKSGDDFKVTVTKCKPSGNMAGSPAIRTVLRYDLQAPNPPALGSSLTTIKGGKAYTMAFTSFASVHDAYMPVFDEMVKSLKITAAPTALKERPRRTAIPAQLR
jgi:hypothetical protein